MDDVRAKGGTAKLLWAANQAGDRIGPVPADWDAPFNTPPVVVAKVGRK